MVGFVDVFFILFNFHTNTTDPMHMQLVQSSAPTYYIHSDQTNSRSSDVVTIKHVYENYTKIWMDPSGSPVGRETKRAHSIRNSSVTILEILVRTGIIIVRSYNRNACYNWNCLLQTYCHLNISAKLSFAEIYRTTSYGNGWRI